MEFLFTKEEMKYVIMDKQGVKISYNCPDKIKQKLKYAVQRFNNAYKNPLERN